MEAEDQASTSARRNSSLKYGAIDSTDASLFWKASSSDSRLPEGGTEGDDCRLLVQQRVNQSRQTSRSTNISSDENILSALRDSLSFPGKPCSVRDLGGTASIPNEIFNLVKNTGGCGALSIPMGIAAFGNSPPALIPAAIWTIFMGAFFGYYFLLVGRVCEMSSAATYREAWEETMGARGSAAVTLFNMLEPFLANLVYSMVLADTFQALSIAAGFAMSRAVSLLAVTFLALLPLCLMKNLEVLAPFSIAGVVGILFATFVLAVRYFDHSYDPDRDGKFLEDLPEYFKPSFGDRGVRGSLGPNVFVLVCMLYSAFVVHYNAPRFWMELKERSVKRFSVVVWSAFAIADAMYIALPAFGFLTFGAASDGYILNNYSTEDKLASASRSLIAVAVITSYPLAFIGLRDGVISLFAIPAGRQTSANLNALTIVLLAVVTALAAYLEDLGMVNAVGGGVSSAGIVFVFPVLMFREAVRDEGDGASVARRREVFLAAAGMWLGIFMGCAGVWMAISNHVEIPE